MSTVESLMSRHVTTLGRNDELSVADDLMTAGRIRHLPVLDEQGRLAGIVTQRDLFHSALVRALGFGTAARDKILQSIVVKNVMTDTVVTTTPDTPLEEAAGVMLEKKIGCLPVIDAEGVLVGILTESDFVAAAAR